MSFTIPQFGPALAEIALATGICIVLIADLFISKERKAWTLWLALATLATEGELPQPRLISGIMDGGGEWQTPTRPADPVQAISPEAAEAILASLPTRDGIKEHAALVLAGPEGSTNAWYLGLAPAAEPRYAVVVVVEGSADLVQAQEAGRTLLKEVIGQ